MTSDLEAPPRFCLPGSQLNTIVESAHRKARGALFKRRLRGLLAAVVGGALTGAIGGLGLGLLFWLVPGPKTITIAPQFPGAVLVVPALWFALAGAVGGGAFAVLLMLAERGRGIAELRWYRMAVWAAVPTIAVMRLAGASWPLAAIGGVVGAGTGAITTFLAKRGVAPAAAEIQVSCNDVEGAGRRAN